MMKCSIPTLLDGTSEKMCYTVPTNNQQHCNSSRTPSCLEVTRNMKIKFCLTPPRWSLSRAGSGRLTEQQWHLQIPSVRMQTNPEHKEAGPLIQIIKCLAIKERRYVPPIYLRYAGQSCTNCSRVASVPNKAHVVFRPRQSPQSHNTSFCKKICF